MVVLLQCHCTMYMANSKRKDTLADSDSPFIVLPNFDSFVLLTYQLDIEIAKKKSSAKVTYEAILN